eukprot:TRINITY_DN14957_c0_g2_i3.p1 TRINITY_DN14957_c0_g2~~TRINITY_DN14957_c0_g2_i3.p1  ORF type:complete len:407 (+),score=161.98 TRINITY_DN14957_c0_g2_i3:809-2029(+)
MKGGTLQQKIVSTMSDNILPRIRKMEKQSDKLKKQGKNLKALEVLEKTLLLKMELYDISSDAVWDTCKTIAEFCNSLALLYLSKGNLTLTHELLKKSLILTENQGWDSQNDTMRLKVRAITYNNIACACQKQENYHTALKNLERALRIEGQLETVNPSGTHLNICAVLSHLGRHAEALEHAKAAVILVEELEKELEERKREEQGYDDDDFDDVDEEEQRQQEEAQSIKAAAFYNMGAEHEHLRQYDEALEAYDGARQVCHMAFGAKHPMTKQMKVAYQDAEKAKKKYLMAKVKRIKKTRGAVAAAVAVEEMGLAPGKKKQKKKKKKKHKPQVRYDAEDDAIDQEVAAAAAAAEKEMEKLKEEDLADFDDGDVEDDLGLGGDNDDDDDEEEESGTGKEVEGEEDEED